MTLVPNEAEQALNRQYDIYAAAREEYRKKIAEQAAEITRLCATLEKIVQTAEKHHKENEERAKWAGSDIAQRKAKAILSRSGVLLYSIKDIARAALEGRT